MKALFLFLAALHCVLLFCSAISNRHTGLHLSTGYIETFFEQGWFFFGPHPVISNSVIEYKCILENEVFPWKNLSKEIDNIKHPYSSIFLSNTAYYFVGASVSEILGNITPTHKKLCDKGECAPLLKAAKSNKYFKTITKITDDICRLKYSENLLATKLRLVFQNPQVYSLKNANMDKINDILEFPAIEN